MCCLFMDNARKIFLRLIRLAGYALAAIYYLEPY